MVTYCQKKCYMTAFCKKQCNEQHTTNSSYVFQTLFEHYNQKIYKFFYSKTKCDKPTAEDLAQETFIKAFRNLDKIEDYCNIANWLYTIATNTLIDYQRKNYNKPLTNDILDISSLNLQTVEGIPCQDLIQNEIKQKFHDIFKSLSQKYRYAICLNEYENHTYAEAATIMNISLAAYTSLLNRARNKLKEAIVANLFGVDKKDLTKSEYASIGKWIAHNQICDDISEPIKQGMQDYFDQQASLYNNPFYHDYHNLIDDCILQRYPLDKNHIVADFGMGTGIFTSKLSRLVKSVDGYDFSKEMCDIAQQKFKDQNINNITCKNLDFLSLENVSSKYDLAYCITVLHHMTYPQETVLKMSRSLKKGGYLIISDLAKHKCTEMVEERSDLWYGFTKEQFEKYLTEAGLKNVWVKIHPKLYQVYQKKSGKLIKINTIIGGGQK